MTANAWIAQIAYEPRRRHAADCRREKATAARLASVHSRILADLRHAIALDIEGFLRKDGSRPGSLICHNTASPEGFIVSRTTDRIGTRRLAVDLKTGTLRCQYETLGTIGSASDQRHLVIEIGNDGVALSLWIRGLVRRFANVDALSAFLLAPILGAT
jgi:hypothetical protein